FPVQCSLISSSKPIGTTAKPILSFTQVAPSILRTSIFIHSTYPSSQVLMVRDLPTHFHVQPQPVLRLQAQQGCRSPRVEDMNFSPMRSDRISVPSHQGPQPPSSVRR